MIIEKYNPEYGHCKGILKMLATLIFDLLIVILQPALILITWYFIIFD
jgi:hypothetical protein